MHTRSEAHPPPYPSDSDSLLKELLEPGKYGAKLEKKLEKNGLGGRWGDKAGQELQLLW